MAGAQLTSLHSFGASGDGAAPAAGVVFDAHGNLYGTTSAGGASGDGIIYTIPLGGSYGVMTSFTDAEGAGSESELTLLSPAACAERYPAERRARALCFK